MRTRHVSADEMCADRIIPEIRADEIIPELELMKERCAFIDDALETSLEFVSNRDDTAFLERNGPGSFSEVY